MIDTPGIYDIAPSAYHADPCPIASLSNSIARTLVRRSPLHAWHAHPRLGGATNGTSRAMDDGTILHHLLLGKGGDIAVIEADNYRTKAAHDARDAARAAGKTPVLFDHLTDLHAIAAAARKQIEAHPDARALFGDGKAEQAMIWREGETWFRSLVDWLPANPRAPMMDLKTTGLSAAPADWERKLVSDYAMQDAFYARGFRALHGVTPPAMLFVVVETEPPHAVSVMAAAPTLRAVADAEVERAVRTWRECMATNRWPGYPPFTAYVEAPTWLLSRMDEQESRDAFLEKNAA